MLQPIILQEETVVLLQETAGLITADRVTVIQVITERVIEAIRGVITVALVINRWEEARGLTPLVPEAVPRVTVEVLQGTEEVHLA